MAGMRINIPSNIIGISRPVPSKTTFTTKKNKEKIRLAEED